MSFFAAQFAVIEQIFGGTGRSGFTAARSPQ